VEKIGGKNVGYPGGQKPKTTSPKRTPTQKETTKRGKGKKKLTVKQYRSGDTVGVNIPPTTRGKRILGRLVHETLASL